MVQNNNLVCGDILDSEQSWYPIVNPRGSHLSVATRVATDKAEIRRGCVHMILQSFLHPVSIAPSRINWGSCVVFPQPLSPETTTTYSTYLYIN